MGGVSAARRRPDGGWPGLLCCRLWPRLWSWRSWSCAAGPLPAQFIFPGYYVPSMGLAPSERCVAFPVYLMNNVPYTNGRVAGSNYTDLANIYTYTRLNQEWATAHPGEPAK